MGKKRNVMTFIYIQKLTFLDPQRVVMHFQIHLYYPTNQTRDNIT